MLKVVGASWVQIRISTFIISVVFVVGLIAIIFTEIAKKSPDGVYAATTFWGAESGFVTEFWGQGNDLNKLSKGVARAYYKPFNNITGWSILEIQTQQEYPDWVQAYSAGLLEGSLTWQIIYWHWHNTVEDTCQGREKYCQRVRDFLTINDEWVRKQAEEYDFEPYWHQIRLFYYQLDGLVHGFSIGVENSRQDIELEYIDFLWMNVASDLTDLERKFDGQKPDTPYMNTLGEASDGLRFDSQHQFRQSVRSLSVSSLLVKLVPEAKKLFVAHNTADEYSTMLKMLKRYEFHYHIGISKSDLVPGTDISFSSYPAAIHSMDDFYVTRNEADHHMSIAGSAINNYNRELWDYVVPNNHVLIGPRVMAANRLSENPEEWSNYLAKYNSGTGNKEWAIVDYLKFETGELENILWVAEQIPRHFVAQDQTQVLLDKLYWSAHGVPFYQEIFNETDTDEMEVRYGTDYSFADSTRAKIVRRDVNKTLDLGTVAKLMRSNYYKKDPISGGDPMRALASRGDVPSDNHPQLPIGVTDVKVYTNKYGEYSNPKPLAGGQKIEDRILLGMVGPTYNNTIDYDVDVDPFDWVQSNFTDLPHVGHPDTWKFDPLYHKWFWD